MPKLRSVCQLDQRVALQNQSKCKIMKVLKSFTSQNPRMSDL